MQVMTKKRGVFERALLSTESVLGHLVMFSFRFL